MNKEGNVLELDLLQLFRALWSKALYIVIAALVFGILGYAGSKMLKTPIYQASTKLIISTQSSGSQDLSNDKLTSAKGLVSTYAVIIRDRDVMERVIAELSMTESPDYLASCISVKAVNNTQIMQVIVQHPSQATAFAVADKIREIVPEVIETAAGVGTVRPVGQAYSSTAPVAPNSKNDAVLAALLGIVLSCGVILLLNLLDNTYKSDAEIQEDLDVLVLGVIPKVECCGRYAKYSYAYGYDRSAQKEEKAKGAK